MEAHEFETLISRFTDRRIAILQDEFSPDRRGVLVASAAEIQRDTVNELIGLSGGLVFVALSPGRVQAFNLSSMSAPREPASGDTEAGSLSCISVEAREGVTTGISVDDRTCTIRILGEDTPLRRKLVSPGHIFPVQVREGGALVKNALPEGALDLIRVARKGDAAVFLDLLGSDGNYLPAVQQEALSRDCDIPLISLRDLIRYRLETENLVERIAETELPSEHGGALKAVIYRSRIHDGEHLALVKGDISEAEIVLTRVQPEFTFADVFGGSSPPTRRSLHRCLNLINEHRSGIVVYLRRPDRGELRAQVASWQGEFAQPPAAIMREYGLGAQILRDLGAHRIDLLTNSKKKLVGLKTFGIEIVSTTRIDPEPAD